MKDQLIQEELGTQYTFNTRELVTRAQYYALSGMIENYDLYFDIVNQDRQRTIILELRRMGMTSAEMDIYLDCDAADKVQSSLESAAMALAAEAMDVDPDIVPVLTQYTWDEESTDDYEKKKQLYPFQKLWLTTSVKDRALSKQEKLNLAHSILFGRMYIGVQDGVEANVRKLKTMMGERVIETSNSNKTTLNSYEVSVVDW